MEIILKYAGYISRQNAEVDRFPRFGGSGHSGLIQYDRVPGLCTEARQKACRGPTRDLWTGGSNFGRFSCGPESCDGLGTARTGTRGITRETNSELALPKRTWNHRPLTISAVETWNDNDFK